MQIEHFALKNANSIYFMDDDSRWQCVSIHKYYHFYTIRQMDFDNIIGKLKSLWSSIALCIYFIKCIQTVQSHSWIRIKNIIFMYFVASSIGFEHNKMPYHHAFAIVIQPFHINAIDWRIDFHSHQLWLYSMNRYSRWPLHKEILQVSLCVYIAQILTVECFLN